MLISKSIIVIMLENFDRDKKPSEYSPLTILPETKIEFGP